MLTRIWTGDYIYYTEVNASLFICINSFFEQVTTSSMQESTLVFFYSEGLIGVIHSLLKPKIW